MSRLFLKHCSSRLYVSLAVTLCLFLLSGLTPEPAGGQTGAFSESFESDAANGWQVLVGPWAVVSDTQKDGTVGKVYDSGTPVPGDTNRVVYGNAFSRDLTFGADVRLVETLPFHQRSLSVFLPDKSTTWTFGYRGDTNELWIARSGIPPLALKGISSAEALKTTWDRLEIRVSGSVLQGWRNGTRELEVTDADLGATTSLLVGFWAGGSRSHFDNVSVSSSVAPTPPNTPSALTAQAVSSTQISLSWQDNSNNEAGFKVERSQPWLVNWAQIASLPANTTSYQDTAVSPNLVYTYRVKAYNQAGDSVYATSAPAYAISATNNQYTLPAAAKNPSNQLIDFLVLKSLVLNGLPQEVTVAPGATISGTATFQIGAPPGAIAQAFLIASWTPSWPPPSGYYTELYNGVPGNYPGIMQTASFTLTAPQTAGTYYLWLGDGLNYSIPLAAGEYRQPLTFPAHGKIVVHLSSAVVTAVSISVAPSSATSSVSTPVTISGKLIRSDTGAGVGGRPLKLDWPVGSANVTTDSNGSYSYQVTVNATQTWVFQVTFSGDSAFTQSWNSIVLSVPQPSTSTPIPPPTQPPPVTTPVSPPTAGSVPVTLSSRTNCGTTNIGKIDFDGWVSLPSTVNAAVGQVYTVSAQVPKGYAPSVGWEISGGLVEISRSTQSISVRPDGPGTITMILETGGLLDGLVIGQPMAPQEVKEGDRFTVTAKLKNWGTALADFRLNAPAYSIVGGVEGQVMTLEPGAEAVYELSLQIPKGTQAGKHTIHLFLQGAIKCKNWSLARKESSISVNVLAVPPPPTVTPPLVAATLSARYDVGQNKLYLSVSSPVAISSAQVKLEIPAGISAKGSGTGFMAGATYLSLGSEHRWFQLSANGDKQGGMEITLSQAVPPDQIRLLRVNLIDTAGNNVALSATLSMVVSSGPSIAAVAPTPQPTPMVTVAPTPAAQPVGATAYIVPDSLQREAGARFQVSVMIDPKGGGISSGEVIITFDPTALELKSISPGTLLGSGAIAGKNTIANDAGTAVLAVARVAATSPPTPPGTLASLDFTVKPNAKPGEYRISISKIGLADQAFRDIPRVGIKHGVVKLGGKTGDINGDGTVDYRDLGILAATYGAKTGEPGFNSAADLNGDGIVDFRDLGILASNYGTGQ